MNKRFTIERLVVAGKGMTSAVLLFHPGANLIIGSSDTGKSYIFQCLNYLLGSDTCPKEIPESKGYTDAFLQLKSDGEIYTLSRELENKSIAYFSKTAIENHPVNKMRIGTRSNTYDGNNISEIILDLMGVKDVLVKKNKNNSTQKLSYRDVANLTLIDEERIITDGSPVYSSKDGYLRFTIEQSIFKYLLTEGDDKELCEIEEKKVRESRIIGKLELLKRFIESKNDSISLLQKSLSETSSIELQEKIEAVISKIQESSTSIERLTEERNSSYNTLQEQKSARLRTKELLDRFFLLRDHYNSDLNRLQFILDGEFIFSQLITKDCPLCGNVMNEGHFDCLSNSTDINSIKIEGEKIKLKIEDLTSTIINSESELKMLNVEIEAIETNLKTIDLSIEHELRPLHQNFQEELKSLIFLQSKEQEILIQRNDITSYHTEKSRLEAELQNKSNSQADNTSLEYDILHSFCGAVELILKEWKYPSLTTIEFNSYHKIYDIMISSRQRNSYGKGLKALSYAAFTIGLLDFCITENKPHPGTVVLDSPLTTYHNNTGQAEGEELPEDILDAFYRYLSETPSDRQIIIMDNKIPSADVIAKVNYISFSNEQNSNRKGFFPNQS